MTPWSTPSGRRPRVTPPAPAFFDFFHEKLVPALREGCSAAVPHGGRETRLWYINSYFCSIRPQCNPEKRLAETPSLQYAAASSRLSASSARAREMDVMVLELPVHFRRDCPGALRMEWA
jgi:hypothetical protein